MTRRLRPRAFGPALGLVLGLGLAPALMLVGCTGETETLKFPQAGDSLDYGDGTGNQALREAEASLLAEEKQDILRQVVQLIRTAATSPGGENFTQAAESLNDYFRNTPIDQFALSAPLADFLAEQGWMPPNAPEVVGRRRFDGQFDGRHLEDSMLYRSVARSVIDRAGPAAADDLGRARSLFDWLVTRVQLAPRGSLGVPSMTTPDGLPYQPQARPYDVLLRGMATEIEGGWAERSWAFLALCRQAGLDAALLVVVPPETDAGKGVLLEEAAAPQVKTMAVGVLIDGQVYLFDARLGLEVPGPGGRGVATLEQAANDPSILAALDLPGRPYPVRPEDLANGKLHALVESSLGSLSPRMKLLQEQLSGENRMVLYRDPTELAARFAAARGPRLASVRLWPLPLEVEYKLFNDGQFNAATGYAMQLFDKQLPLVAARLAQLRGESDDALLRYVSFLNVDDLLMTDGKTPVPPVLRDVLNKYATYFLGLAQMDRGRDDQAQDLLEQVLKQFPEPGRGRPYFYMFRWGAQSNLARLYQAEGAPELAARYYSQPNPTDQYHGDRLRARALIWADPFVPEADVPELPEAPEPDRIGAPAGPFVSGPGR